MFTDGVDVVDAGSGLWISVTEIARQRGVSKQAVSKKVERLGLETRPGPQGSKLVNLAAYDKAVGSSTDAVRAANGRHSAPSAAPNPNDPVLAREQARRTAYQADIAKLDLEERLKTLIPVAEVRDALALATESIIRAMEQLPTRADEVAAAVAKEGAHGARIFLRTVVTDLRKSVARVMQDLADQGLATQQADPAPEAA